MEKRGERISNYLAEVRERRGLAAAELAKLAGVTRQTIYAIEGDHYMPNTGLALRLARILEVAVEELFELDADVPVLRKAVEAEVISNGPVVKPGQPVQLCSVAGTTIAVPAAPVPMYLPTADGVISESAGRGKRRNGVVLMRQGAIPNRLLIAGCDPALSVLAAHAQEAGVNIALAGCNSSQALELLRNGRIHVAGTHLGDATGGESNLPAVRRLFARESVRIVTFASWQQGFVVAAGNPKKIRSAGDLARSGVRIVNREPGSGSRILLGLELQKAGVPSRQICGYNRLARGHLPAAWHVLSGLADCCVATEAAARAFGLDFVPIRSERFDLVIPKEPQSPALVERVLDAMQRSAFRHELEVLGGYDTLATGKIVA
jgi:molybdate-binding protein/DNA-binding XRE family transcriptional regulator